MGASLSNFDINFLNENRESEKNDKDDKNIDLEHIKYYVDKIISSSIKDAVNDLNLNNNNKPIKLDYKMLYDELLQKYQILTEKYHNLEFERNILNDTCNNLLLKKKND